MQVKELNYKFKRQNSFFEWLEMVGNQLPIENTISLETNAREKRKNIY